jgi:hypothetical protein
MITNCLISSSYLSSCWAVIELPDMTIPSTGTHFQYPVPVHIISTQYRYTLSKSSTGTHYQNPVPVDIIRTQHWYTLSVTSTGTCTCTHYHQPGYPACLQIITTKYPALSVACTETKDSTGTQYTVQAQYVASQYKW